MVNLAEETILFVLVHSPIIARLFKRNLVFSSLLNVIQSTSPYRNYHFVFRSSKSALKDGRDGNRIESESLSDFIELLTNFDQSHGFVADMFPRRLNTGKGGGVAPVAGNTFYLLLAHGLESWGSRETVVQFVEASWPLFLCLYPIRPIAGRSASLRKKHASSRYPQSLRICSHFFSRRGKNQPIVPRRGSGSAH